MVGLDVSVSNMSSVYVELERTVFRFRRRAQSLRGYRRQLGARGTTSRDRFGQRLFSQWGNDGLELGATKVVLDLDPLSVGNADFFGVLRVDFNDRIGSQFAKNGNLAMLCMERGVVTRSCE